MTKSKVEGNIDISGTVLAFVILFIFVFSGKITKNKTIGKALLSGNPKEAANMVASAVNKVGQKVVAAAAAAADNVGLVKTPSAQQFTRINKSITDTLIGNVEFNSVTYGDNIILPSYAVLIITIILLGALIYFIIELIEFILQDDEDENKILQK